MHLILDFTVTPRDSLLLETMIANAMHKIVEEQGVYVPPNMKRGVRVSFHIDNFDELVQTFDGKNTAHYLLIVGFQRSSGYLEPLQLTLKKTKSLMMDSNSSFAELLPCEEPSNRTFKRTSGCKDVTCSAGFSKSRSPSLSTWSFLRSLEHLLVIDEKATYLKPALNGVVSERWNLESLCIPSFGATNSLVSVIDTTLTNIFVLPFVAGPATSTSAVYTALDIADKTNTVTQNSLR